MSCENCGVEDSVLTSKLTYTPAFLCTRCAEDQAIRNRTEKAELEQLVERLGGYLEAWQAWSRKLHHEFGWLPETTWPDDTKGREKIEAELRKRDEEIAAVAHRCFFCRQDKKDEPSTKLCLDAAGDPMYTCDEHAFTGGMLDDDPPVELRWAPAVRRLKAKQKEA